jgi:hypothetical protein
MVVISTVLASDRAAAQTPAPGQATGEAGKGFVGGELGFGQVDEDFFVTININGALSLEVPKAFCHGYFADEEATADPSDACQTRLGIGLRVPLRLRVIDEDPQDVGTLRKEDWDTFSDFARIIRYIEYGHRSDPLYARLGEFNGATLGHGTIMNRYYNVLFVDLFQLGLNLGLNANIGGVEFVMDNLLEPQVFGQRVFMRPAHLVDPDSWWTRYTVGMSLVADVDAPLDFQRVSVEVDPLLPKAVSEDRKLIPTQTENTAVLGIDQELELVRTQFVDFIPYLDINFHLGQSAGAHLGVMTNLRPDEALRFYSRLELRQLGQNYLPAYFGSLYEVERDTFFNFGGQGDPKLVVLKSLDRGSLAGAYGELTVDFAGAFVLSGAYEDYKGPDNASIWLKLQLPEVGPITLAGVFHNTGFDDIDGMFELDNALLVAEARYAITPFLYAVAQFSRQFSLQDNGEYETINNWQVSTGVSIGF